MNSSQNVAGLSMHSPLSALVRRKPVCVTPETPLREALQMMVEEGVDSIVVIEQESNRPVGIFTLRDLLVRVAAKSCDVEQRIDAVMSGSGLVTLNLFATLYQAALLMARHGLHQVIVVDASGRLAGIASQNDIYRLLRGGDKAISGAIRNARDMDALVAAAGEIRRLTRQMLADGKSAEALTQEISTLNDLLTVRIIELTAAEFTLPDVAWCWLAFGSEGRFEQTFSTDQDNGIVFATPGGDHPDAAETGRLRDVFLPFAAAVNRRLDTCGFTLCKGDIMAGNPEWCLSLGEWRDKFSGWLHAAEPQALLNATIFFDLRPLYGSEFLAEELRDWLYSRSPSATMFLRFMAENAIKAVPPLGLIHDFTFDRSERFPHTLDLKAFGARPFVDAARIFALANGVAQTGTAQRLRLLAELMHLSRDDVAAMLDGFYYIQLLRLRHQQDTTIDTESANRIDPDTLNELGRHILKEAFKQARKLQQRLRFEYRL
jgi:CBS domain-containing protein